MSIIYILYIQVYITCITVLTTPPTSFSSFRSGSIFDLDEVNRTISQQGELLVSRISAIAPELEVGKDQQRGREYHYIQTAVVDNTAERGLNQTQRRGLIKALERVSYLHIPLVLLSCSHSRLLLLRTLCTRRGIQLYKIQ